MNRFVLLVVALVGAGVLGMAQPAQAVDNEVVPTINGCAHGDYNNGTGLCDCNTGYHRTNDNHCDENTNQPPWVPPMTPLPPGIPIGPGGGGGTHPPATHGPFSKACNDCKAAREQCVKGTDAGYYQCGIDIQHNAEHICVSEGHGADGVGYTPIQNGYDETLPCLVFSHDASHECLLMTSTPHYDPNPHCVESYMDGFWDYTGATGRFNTDWLTAQNKHCSDQHVTDMTKCNDANKCETTVCK